MADMTGQEAAKKPWEMRAPQELAALKHRLDSGEVLGWETTLSQHLDFARQHDVGAEGLRKVQQQYEAMIVKALSEGKPVPPEVLGAVGSRKARP